MTYHPRLGTAEADIITALADSLTVQQLVDATGQDLKPLRKRIRALRREGLVCAQIEDGHLVYARAKKPTPPPAPPRKRAPAAIPAPAAATAAPEGRRRKPLTGLTDAIRQVLATAGRPLTYGEVNRRLPQFTGNQIAAILYQRTKAGEFVAYPPEGRGRAYTLAGRGPTPEAYAAAVDAAMNREQVLAELRDQETYLRETAAGQLVAADRIARIIREFHGGAA